jgi:hypothetical protein
MNIFGFLRFIKISVAGVALFFATISVFATHNTSRYFPFLERPEEYVIRKRSHISPSLFYSKASTAFKRGGGNTGIPELWGKYDLKDVIGGLEKVKRGTLGTFVNPIETERGPGDSWVNKSIKYQVDGKLKALGIILNYEQDFKWNGFQAGASIPLMHLNASERFSFLGAASDWELQSLRGGELLQLDRIRRAVHKELGLQGGDWTKSGFGDLDLHLRWNYNWDHKLRMKSIDLNLQTGVVIPTGVTSDISYSPSVSFMGNGHWTWYFDIVPKFELKQDWKLGFMFGYAHQFNNSRKLKVPVYKEPAIFSALIADVKIDPGDTFKVSPYFTLGNLTDGVDFHVRYTYLRHNMDSWYDKRKDPAIKSYLNQEAGTEISGVELTAEDISKNIAEKENLSLWRMHYITLQFTYDTKEANNNWVLDPIIYATFDYQFSGNGSCKTHQLTIGAELHF